MLVKLVEVLMRHLGIAVFILLLFLSSTWLVVDISSIASSLNILSLYFQRIPRSSLSNVPKFRNIVDKSSV